MIATVTQPTRPDTSDLYEFTWFTESGLSVECFLDYNQPDQDNEIIPSAPLRDHCMELRYAFVCGVHDFAPNFTGHVIQEIEHMALLDYLRKDRDARDKKFGPFFGPSRDYSRSFASLLG